MRAFDNTQDGEIAAYRSGQFILATIGNSQRARQWCIDNGVMNAMSEGDDLKGGNLVPPEFETAIIKRMEDYGVFPRYVNRTTMVSETKTIPRRVSGLTVYFPGEGGSITDSDATYNQVNLVAKKATTLTKVSSELSEDAVISIADELAMEAAYAHAVKIDQIGFLGDGTTTYAGIMGLDNVLAAGAISTATSTTIGALTLVEAEACVAKLPQLPGIRPVWFMHSALYWNGAARLMLAGGGNTTMTIGGGPSYQFMGYPVVFTQCLSSAGTTGTTWAFFGDLSLAATMGVRRGLSMAADASVYFATDQIGVRSTYRYDIAVHEIGTASVAGPIVKCKLG
jgi:HK97 family phage major capsid protein